MVFFRPLMLAVAVLITLATSGRAHEGIFSKLTNPEYLHVLINPIPIFGMGLGLILLSVAWFRPAAGLAEAGPAVIIATGLLTRGSRPLAARRLMLATMAASGLCAGLAGLIAHAGGQVRHLEFRESAPPVGALKKARPDAGPQRETLP